jgi:hypothetical protein
VSTDEHVDSFPGGGGDDRPRIVIAVADELYALLPTNDFTTDGYRVVYVPASSLADPAREADLWIGRYAPSAPGRSLFFQTVSGATYEADEEGRVWRNGLLAWDGALLDFGDPATGEQRILRAGHPAALLFAARVAHGVRLRVRRTTPVILVGTPPALAMRPTFARNWLRIAGASR